MKFNHTCSCACEECCYIKQADKDDLCHCFPYEKSYYTKEKRKEIVDEYLRKQKEAAEKTKPQFMAFMENFNKIRSAYQKIQPTPEEQEYLNRDFIYRERNSCHRTTYGDYYISDSDSDDESEEEEEKKETKKKKKKKQTKVKETKEEFLPKVLKDNGIRDKKSWKLWLRSNHPDKNPQIKLELCQNIIREGRQMGW